MDARQTARKRHDIAEPRFSLDRIDRRILYELQRDGRLTNLDLANRIGLSPSPCLRRVRRLETEGILSRYVALVDAARVGLDLTVFTRVSLERQTDETLATFEAAVVGWPEVMECYLMTGESDFQLRIVVSGMAVYETFLRDRLTKVDGIAKIQSSFAFRPLVYRTGLPTG